MEGQQTRTHLPKFNMSSSVGPPCLLNWFVAQNNANQKNMVAETVKDGNDPHNLQNITVHATHRVEEDNGNG